VWVRDSERERHRDSVSKAMGAGHDSRKVVLIADLLRVPGMRVLHNGKTAPWSWRRWWMGRLRREHGCGIAGSREETPKLGSRGCLGKLMRDHDLSQNAYVRVMAKRQS